MSGTPPRHGVRPPGSTRPGIPRLSGLAPDQAASKLEALARGHDRALGELSREAEAAAAARKAAEAGAPRVFANVELKDGKETTITHNLGSKPKFVRESCPRGIDPAVIVGSTGRVVAVPSVAAAAPYDEAKDVVLRADGWAVDIVVDVLVVP